MKTCETNEVENFPARHLLTAVKQSLFEANHLHLVTIHDLQSLRDALARGQVPVDLEAKLISLSKGDLVLRSIEKNCRTIHQRAR